MGKTPCASWRGRGLGGEKAATLSRGCQCCLRCGAPIERCVQGGRSTFFCPRCQGE
ncbi:MAG: hypothetical protein J6333_04995 [Planctomycetes bacterium]|nr:hypothetical protein [Planctomycetota bacterium]